MTPRLNQLAINTDGFIFDPTTGESFTANQTGILCIEGFKMGKSVEDIKASILEGFDVTEEQAERDINDFVSHLKTYRLL